MLDSVMLGEDGIQALTIYKYLGVALTNEICYLKMPREFPPSHHTDQLIGYYNVPMKGVLWLKKSFTALTSRLSTAELYKSV